MTSATLRAAAAIITAAADRTGRDWWQRIADDLNALADDLAPELNPENERARRKEAP